MKAIHLGALLEELICGAPRLVPQPQVCARGSGVIPMCCCALSPAPHTFPPMLCHCLTCLQAEPYSKTHKKNCTSMVGLGFFVLFHQHMVGVGREEGAASPGKCQGHC